MEVIEIPNGRLGNGIFRYLACIILQIKYGAIRVYNISNNSKSSTIVINDGNYNDLIISIDKDRKMFSYSIIILDGYFQFDIYSEEYYKKKIIQFIKDNPNDNIYITDLNRKYMSYTARELMDEPNDMRTYDIVIHVRLEDFMTTNNMIHPDTLINIIKDIYKSQYGEQSSGIPIVAIVCNKITTEHEKKYIQYIYDNHKTPMQFLFESNDVIIDFHIMKNARILVCSLSTLSWCAALLSEKIKTVYVPKNKSGSHQTFLRPIENTILYDNNFCDINDLNALFNGK